MVITKLLSYCHGTPGMHLRLKYDECAVGVTYIFIIDGLALQILEMFCYLYLLIRKVNYLKM